MGWITAGIAGLIGISLSIPFVGYLVGPALKRRPQQWDEAGSTVSLVIDQPVQMQTVVEFRDGWLKTVATRGVWVVKREKGELRVYNPHCTHLGCGYHWDEVDRLFKCPCHAGVYNLDGTVIAGPPPRPLDTLDYRVDEKGVLKIRYQNFKAGSSKKIPI